MPAQLTLVADNGSPAIRSSTARPSAHQAPATEKSVDGSVTAAHPSWVHSAWKPKHGASRLDDDTTSWASRKYRRFRAMLNGREETGASPDETLASEPGSSTQESRNPLTNDRGAVTAEYAIIIMAGVAFAGLMVAIMRSGEIRQMLIDLVQNALGTAG